LALVKQPTGQTQLSAAIWACDHVINGISKDVGQEEDLAETAAAENRPKHQPLIDRTESLRTTAAPISKFYVVGRRRVS
jgi:hypothetical protein